MPEANPVAAALAGASQSLRDTAKWLVGGVAATAAGVFAGSSLTAFGTLDPFANALRFGEAAGGLLAGFIGLGAILGKAIRVLTRESATFREFATSDSTEIAAVRHDLETRHRDRLPTGATTFAEYVNRVQAAVQANPRTADDQRLIERAREDNQIISADASFFLLRVRFDQLICTLKWASILCIIGFGTFAWAANPPKAVPEPPAFSLTIQGHTHH